MHVPPHFLGSTQSTPLLFHNLTGSKSNHRLQLIASYNFPNYQGYQACLPEVDIYKRKELILEPGLTMSPYQPGFENMKIFVENFGSAPRNSEASGLPTTCLLRFSLVGSNFQIGANLHQFSGLVPTLSPLGTLPPSPFGPNFTGHQSYSMFGVWLFLPHYSLFENQLSYWAFSSRFKYFI